MAKEITLQDVADAFAAGRAKTDNYRGQGRVDTTITYPTVTDFYASKGKGHLKAAYKKEANEKAAEAKRLIEIEIKKAKAAEEAMQQIED